MANLLHSDPPTTHSAPIDSELESAPVSVLELEIARARATWEADFERYQQRVAWWAEQSERWRGFIQIWYGTDVPEAMLKCIITGVFICWPLVCLFGVLLWKLGHPVDLSLEAGYVIFAGSLFSAPLVHALDWCGYQLLAARARKEFIQLPPWEPAFELGTNGLPGPPLGG